MNQISNFVSRAVKYLHWRLGKMLYVRKVQVDGEFYYAFRGELYPSHLHGGNAQSHISSKALTFCQGTGLDVGADRWPFSNARPIRNLPKENAFELDSIQDDSQDYVFSSHCLEHLDPWDKALKLWISKLRRGGVLFLYLPHKDMALWRPGSPWVLEGHKWSPDVETLLPFLTNHGMEILEYQPKRDGYWSFYIAARRVH